MYISKVLFPLNGCSCNLDQSKTAPALETESHKIDDDITKSTNLPSTPNEAPQIPNLSRNTLTKCHTNSNTISTTRNTNF